MTKVKICGIMQEEDIRACVKAGVHALGFVVEYPVDVPWNLDRGTAEKLLNFVPPFVYRVVVVGDEKEKVLELAARLRPHAIQLHGNEALSTTKELTKRLHDLGIQVLKALRFHVEKGACLGENPDPLKAAEVMAKTGVDAIVLDSVSEKRPAGTGQKIDWGMARKIRDSLSIPLILAGGLTPENVNDAIATVNPYGVDVISGVESLPGKKDPFLIEAFVRATLV